MPVYERKNIPTSVCRGTLDPELKAWLPKGPTLGADVSIAQGRRDHTVLGEGPWPTIGAVETLELPGPHGSLAARKHTPTNPTSVPSGALVYIHGGGFTYGTLDEFEVPMRLIAERAGSRIHEATNCNTTVRHSIIQWAALQRRPDLIRSTTLCHW